MKFESVADVERMVAGVGGMVPGKALRDRALELVRNEQRRHLAIANRCRDEIRRLEEQVRKSEAMRNKAMAMNAVLTNWIG